MSLESFFRRNYLTMCRYCACFGFIHEDVEEQVVDVLLRHFEIFWEKCQQGHDDEKEVETMVRKWSNRRVMLNLRSIRLRAENAKRDGGEGLSEDACGVSLEDPMEIFSLKQRIPKKVNPILIEYEKNKGWGKANEKGDVVKFCRARREFLRQLENGE